MTFRRRSRLMLCRSSHGRRRRWLMHDRCRRWSLLMHRRRGWRCIHVMFRLPLRGRRERLRRRSVLPLGLRRWRRALIVRAPYWFRRRLMVITSAIEIASTIAIVPRWLPIHDFRIAIVIDASPIMVHIWLWLRWRIVRPRHSRYIIIGVHAPVASVSTGAAQGMLISIAVSNPAANGTSASSHRSTGHRRWFVMISVWATINDSSVRRRNWRTEARRRMRQPGPAIPSVPSARRPAPAASVDEHPLAVAIGHPSPWVRRNPRIAKAGRVAPIAVAEWVPVVANIVRLPDLAVSRDVIILAVIIQVARAILVRRLCVARTSGSVCAQKVVALLTPLVQIVRVHAFIQRITGHIIGIQDKGFIFLDGNFAAVVRVAHAYFTLPHRDVQRIRIGAGHAK